MALKTMSPEDRVQEVLGFSQDFLSRVLAQRVYESESEGGGYALTSKVRDDYHIPTGTAPSTIRNSLETLKQQFDASATGPSPYLVEVLEHAVWNLRSAGSFIKEKSLRGDYDMVKKGIDRELPDIEKIVKGFSLSFNR